jgi:hypothetical protein
MTDPIIASPSRALATAQAGPLLEAELIPLTNQGKLRVTYNWLYSALNCDPGDDSAFRWRLAKTDDTHVSLSPADQYRGMTLYASVRDDWSWYVQVQAPRSADWIRAVGRNEILGFESQDLLIASFTGWNQQYVAVDPGLSPHDGHSGYRLRSVGTSNPKARLWFLAVTSVLQAGLNVRLARELSEDDLRASLSARGVTATSAEIAAILRRFSHS